VRAFVTGGAGFVGQWLQRHLGDAGDEVSAPEVDITEPDALRDAVVSASPEVIYHLAAITNVGESWGAPRQTFEVNAVGTLNLLESARQLAVSPRVILVCSAEVYGQVGPAELPLTEDSPLRPVSPYAASKVAAEFLGLQAFLAHGLPVIRVRAFNHIGPGQADTFVVSSLAHQIAKARAGGGAGVIEVGNLTPQRDFTDVRDVVRAYRLLAQSGVPGAVYNICSGQAVAIEEIAHLLLGLAGTDIRLEVDPARVRPVEVPILCGDNGRLVAATGWDRQFTLQQTLADVLAWWSTELPAS